MKSSSNHGTIVAVCKKAKPGIPKINVEAILLLENYGVEGDYHAGKFVRHRYLAKKDPTVPNVRQVLLIDTTILSYLAEQDIHLEPGMMGENLVLDGISVMDLPLGTQLEVGEATLEMTEVRNPCYQLNESHPQLLKAVEKSGNGSDGRNAGMMARILKGGWVRPGDPVLLIPQTEPVAKSTFTVDDLLSSYPPPIRSIAGKLREIILEAAPGALEKANRGWRSISYRDKQVGYFCGIFPFEDHVDLIFEFGVLLPDPDGILQGDAKQVRYLRFHDLDEVHTEEIIPLLLAALDLPPQHAARRGLTQSQGSSAEHG
jgi:MOSC domain-containing protein YiiM